MILITTHHHLWLEGKSIRSFNRRQNAPVWASCCHADAYRVAAPPPAGPAPQCFHTVWASTWTSQRRQQLSLIGTASDTCVNAQTAAAGNEVWWAAAIECVCYLQDFYHLFSYFLWSFLSAICIQMNWKRTLCQCHRGWLYTKPLSA